MPNPSQKRAVLIPARNEERSLERVIAGIRLAATDIEIVVVNSDSTDNTKSIAERLGATVVDQIGSGYAGALKTGYRYLAANGFTQVVQIDADGQHPASEIPRVFSALSQVNWVIGSRMGTDSSGGLDRRIGNAFLSLLVRLVTGETIRDVTSGYWGLDTKALLLFARHFPEHTADANVRVMGVRLGLTIREVAVTMSDRQTGESMHDGVTGLKNFARSVVAVRKASLKYEHVDTLTSG